MTWCCWPNSKGCVKTVWLLVITDTNRILCKQFILKHVKAEKKCTGDGNFANDGSIPLSTPLSHSTEPACTTHNPKTCSPEWSTATVTVITTEKHVCFEKDLYRESGTTSAKCTAVIFNGSKGINYTCACPSCDRLKWLFREKADHSVKSVCQRTSDLESFNIVRVVQEHTLGTYWVYRCTEAYWSQFKSNKTATNPCSKQVLFSTANKTWNFLLFTAFQTCRGFMICIQKIYLGSWTSLHLQDLI